jgi:serine phosphatase RsbU (regulator of sigma subunit)
MNIMEQLGNLEAAGLLQVAQMEPDLEYLFRHSLVQEAVYSSLLESDRKRLHLVVGETVEILYPDRLDEFAGMLAQHFQNAGVDEKAHQYYLKAGNAALEAYANQEAENQFRRALTLVCCDADRAKLLTGLGEALYRQSRFDDALDAWREGIEYLTAAGEFNQVAFLYARSARVAWHAGDHEEALRLSNEGLEVVAGWGESPEMAMLIHEAARSCFFNKQDEKAFQLCRKALKMAEKFNDIASQADALATYGVLKNLSEEEAQEALEKAVDLAESAGYLGIALRAYHNLATITGSHEGGREASRRYFKKAAELGRRRGVAVEEHYSLAGALGYARAGGDLDEAEAYLQRMDELARQMHDPEPALFINEGHRAALLFMRGDWEASLALIRRCYQAAREENDLNSLQELGGDLVSALLELNLYERFDDWDEMERLIQEHLQAVAESGGDPMWPSLQLAILRARQRRISEAWEALQKAEQADREKKTIWRDNYIGHAQAEIAAAEGKYEDAIAIFEGVAARYARLGARWSLARTLHDWAEIHIKSRSAADYERARALLREAQTLYEAMGARGHADWMEVRLKVVMNQIFKLALISQQDAQELARAAKIQGSFLPKEVPAIEGWSLAVHLDPARQTSGDFYDFIPFANNRWGILVADVADKGAAAALFMTTSRSLIRTYAYEYELWPEIVLSEANRRLLADTRAGLFVTVFYGILDPQTGLLTYANAGHNPPYLLRQDGGIQPLYRTGTPLGAFEEVSWEQAQVRFLPGDSLVVYTDGVIDAQDKRGTLFGDARLVTSLEAHRGNTAKGMLDDLLKDLRGFVGDAPQFDDITLMVLAREQLPEGGDNQAGMPPSSMTSP